MAAYEYVCMACERRFEERRAMTAPVDTVLACPSCGSQRVRRSYSFAAAKPADASSRQAPHASGGCACGGACACRS